MSLYLASVWMYHPHEPVVAVVAVATEEGVMFGTSGTIKPYTIYPIVPSTNNATTPISISMMTDRGDVVSDGS